MMGSPLAVLRLWLLLPLLALTALGAQAIEEDELLDPAVAFAVSAEAVAADRVAVRWEVADGYYMYRERIGFESLTPGVSLGEPRMPQGKEKEDEFFGKVHIFRHAVVAEIPIDRSPGIEALVLEVGSQGCADIGVCYPPQKQQLTVPLLAAAQAPSDGQPSAGEPILGADSVGGGNSVAFGQTGDMDLTAGGEDELLDPELAFIHSVEVIDGDSIALRWDIATGYYLYRHKLAASIQDAEGVRVARLTTPAGEPKADEFFGAVEVYHQAVEGTIELDRSTTEPQSVTLVLEGQGCAEIGVCYPPMTREMPLELPAFVPPAAAATVADGEPPGPATAPAATAQPAPPVASSAGPAPQSEQDELAAALETGGWWVILVFFGLGLLLAFTPCVFPMIPILSGIIAGQGTKLTTRRAFLLSLTYVLAMALTYAVAGVLAGLFGQNLQAIFQDPWVLSIFAAVFVALAFSMFGYYELQLPSSWQTRLSELSNRQQGGDYTGVAIMGFLSALIVGPCVAPPLMGALIYIGQTGDAVLGFVALFSLSLGMGAPLILIGTSAGKLLPRAGRWMDAVKAVFGVLLLAVAIYLLERIVPPVLAMIFWGLLLIGSATYMGALEPAPANSPGWRRLWKGLGVALLIYGALMLVGVAAGGKDSWQPLRGIAPVGGGVQELSFSPIKTVADLDQELARGQPVMLDFYADWCVSCKEMEKYTFSDPQVIRSLDGVRLLKADVTANDAADQTLLKRFDLIGPPAILFFRSDGQEVQERRVVGFMAAEAFAAQVRAALP